MFDDRSFSDAAFSRTSWLMSALAAARRELVRLLSPIARLVSLISRV